jgi:hypothetical protein
MAIEINEWAQVFGESQVVTDLAIMLLRFKVDVPIMSGCKFIMEFPSNHPFANTELIEYQANDSNIIATGTAFETKDEII